MAERSDRGGAARAAARSRLLAAGFGVLLLAGTAVAPAVAPASAGGLAPGDDASPRAEAIQTVTGSLVRFEPQPSTHLRLVDRGRYAGAFELRSAAPGIVVNELGLEEYVAGVDEMPSRWHLEALRAQAIVARTYAWYSIGLDSFDGYDICATTSCQVYRGIGAHEDGEAGAQWLDAVRDTAGSVLVHDGRPILARYFSTSGGQTVPNEVAFPSSGPRPYLVGIDDPYDAASPYHRWTVRFTHEEFDTLLARGDTLSAVVPFADVERLGDVDDPGATVRVTGQAGDTVDVGARELREFLSRMAPDSFPGSFPQRRADGLRPLPTTVPSSRFAPQVTDDEVVLHGRGWGHAVGMGQYGANARAQAGHDHLEILAAYYDGLEPTIPPDLPSSIRVGLEVPGPHDIAGTGAFRIVVDGEVAVDRALGTWTASHDGSAWRLDPPDGHDDPLEVSATRLGTSVSGAPGTVTVEAEVNKPALLRLEVADDAGEHVAVRELGAVEAGSHTTIWRSVDAEGEPLPAGDYRVALMAEDASGATAGRPVTVTVQETGDGSAPQLDDREPASGFADGAPWFVIAAAVALLFAAVALGVTTRRRAS